MGLFVKDGIISVSGFLILVGIPITLFASDRWKIGITLIVLGLFTAISQAMNEIEEEDKHEILYRNMSAADISDELEAMDNFMANKERAKCLAALTVLAMKQSQNQQQSSPEYHPHELENICQEASYIVLRRYPNDDEAVAAAISLNALVAKDEQVRERHLHEADAYGFSVPIDVMRAALKRAQKSQHIDESEERLSAELQRKACLLLGALADNDAAIATKIVDEGGLEAILDTLKWYRFHEEVANWGLWAIFILCYEHSCNKQEMVRLGGIQVVCLIMKNNVTSLEVSRHGTAILFDLLREAQGDSLSKVSQIRQIALNAGLHNVLVNTMNGFDNSMEIVMMGQEMLVATGYQGEIPRYQPTS